MPVRFTLLTLLALGSVMAPTADGASSTAASSAIALPDGDTPPPGVYATEASTTVFTAENENWFNQLINLNPNSSNASFGQGIIVTNPPNEPFTLPNLPIPKNVKLTS